MSATYSDRIHGIETSLAIKAPVLVATTEEIVLSGEQTIDGVGVVVGDRVLVKDQSSKKENGIYVVGLGLWARSTDFNGARDCVQGTLVYVVSGSISMGYIYHLNTGNPVIGSSNLEFSIDFDPALYMRKSANLSDLADAATARTNLGLGTAATIDFRSELPAVPETAVPVGGLLRVIETGDVLQRVTDATPDADFDYGPGGAPKFNLIMNFVTPQSFGAVAAPYRASRVLDGSEADCWPALQAAADHLAKAGGGVIYMKRGCYRISKPLVLQYGVSLVPESRHAVQIIKDTADTVAVTITASALIPKIYAPSTLPSNLNAVIVLDGPVGRYVGSIEGVELVGALSNPADRESCVVEFGIVATGDVSDSNISFNSLWNFQYGIIARSIFTSFVRNNRINQCLRGIGLDGTSTSCDVINNYVNSARDYGYAFRQFHYSRVASNALDSLNYRGYYPDTSRLAIGYFFESMFACKIEANGQEQTLGINWYISDLQSTSFLNNLSSGLGSDYTGPDEIAWIYCDGYLVDSVVQGNMAFGAHGNGLIQGAANPAKHHNIYFKNMAYVHGETVRGNRVRASRSAAAKAPFGWGNDVVHGMINATAGGQRLQQWVGPTLIADTMGDLVVTYDPASEHYLRFDGKIVEVFGVMRATVSHSSASGRIILTGFPVNIGIPARLNVPGAPESFGFTRLPNSIQIGTGSGNGVMYAQDENYFEITNWTTGVSLTLSYHGIYRWMA